MSSYKTSFIGLGVMGYPMAGHLAAAGHQVSVYNRTAAKARAWLAAHRGAGAETPAAAAEGADFVFVCVGNDDDLRSVMFGADGALAGIGAGAVLVDHTTASADVAREVAAAAADKSAGFLDAPVSGGQAGAEGGQLTVMVGGDAATFAKAQPVIAAYAKAVTLMGPVGAGQLTKMANQICIAGLVQGLSEGLDFAIRAGLDAKLAAQVMGGGAAQSWQMDNRAATMIGDEFEFGFAVDWMCKDLDIALAESERIGARLPVTAEVAKFYRAVQKMGGGRWDTSSLIKLLR